MRILLLPDMYLYIPTHTHTHTYSHTHTESHTHSLNISGSERMLVPALLMAPTVTADAPQDGTVNVALVCDPLNDSSLRRTPDIMIEYLVIGG